MKENITLQEIVLILKKRLTLIFLFSVLAAFSSGVISYYLLTPVYQASTQILVNQARTEQQLYDPSAVQTNLQLINTYNAIIKSPAILEKVSQNLAMGATPEQLASKIFVSNEESSQVINIVVEDERQGRAADIANETATVFQQEIVNIMNVNNVSILAAAKIDNSPVPISPRPLLNIVLAAGVGLLAGIISAFLLEYLDNTIRNEKEIEQFLGIPTLGAIATIESLDDEDQTIDALKSKKESGETIEV